VSDNQLIKKNDFIFWEISSIQMKILNRVFFSSPFFWHQVAKILHKKKKADIEWHCMQLELNLNTLDEIQIPLDSNSI
jgi:hypothetical protein